MILKKNKVNWIINQLNKIANFKFSYPNYFNQVKAPSFHSIYNPINKIIIKIKEVSIQNVYLLNKKE